MLRIGDCGAPYRGDHLHFRFTLGCFDLFTERDEVWIVAHHPMVKRRLAHTRRDRSDLSEVPLSDEVEDLRTGLFGELRRAGHGRIVPCDERHVCTLLRAAQS